MNEKGKVLAVRILRDYMVARSQVEGHDSPSLGEGCKSDRARMLRYGSAITRVFVEALFSGKTWARPLVGID